ncbi:MAG: glutamine--tRNA ligase/YqeY domain fusion protein [Candidatus Sericytochromatia bacterium]|nr:glutamine--tRNA ligase/YqeY domain fusion protein [Candidatus Sericytochromatia bacterium]
MTEESVHTTNFIRNIIDNDLQNNKNNGKVATRFPPEPNGYLHIGHAKSICINFGLAKEYQGTCNLRFDDTNPAKEDIEYVESIQNDIKWLGFEWSNLHFASDYFDKLYDYAVQLVKSGKAYVDSLSADQIREYRGTLKEAGKNSPDRDRSIEENLDLFERMKNGEFDEGTYIVRAKIDMSSPNINMRDPAIYRIKKAHHHRTDYKWSIYPMYDYAHGVSDAIEGITHSICTLEFEDHRPLYYWFLEQLNITTPPQQIEFAKLKLDYTVMSKRTLLKLVQEKYVSGWDDPRMLTIAGLRRRGYTPESIRNLIEITGVSKSNGVVEFGQLEYCIREDLNKKVNRIMGILKPLKVVITNYPEGKTEEVDIDNNPEDETAGKRMLSFSKTIYIEQDDFTETPPKGYFRLAPGIEVRLKQAYYIKLENIIRDENGIIEELHCTYDPESKGGTADGRKIKGTIQWVSEQHAINAEVRLYSSLFSKSNPDAEENYQDALNPDSLIVLKDCKLEASMKNAEKGKGYQFIRNGYFCLDQDSSENNLVFNRTVTLKDSWAKEKSKSR